MSLIFNVILLVTTQMIMLAYTKRAMKHASLPFLLCSMQFTVSALLSFLILLWKDIHARGGDQQKKIGSSIINSLWIPRSLIQVAVIPLAISWASGFVLFNASASHMSPALVSLVRCTEPLATVLLGISLGKKYSPSVLTTLIPICGGVMLAGWQSSKGHPSIIGISLAMLSNVSFCCRPYLLKQIKAYRTKEGRSLHSMIVFFHVVLIASLFLPFAVLLSEGRALSNVASNIMTDWLGQKQFIWDLIISSISFFLYQYIQLMIMSILRPLSFSVLTPVVKAIVIVACAFCFGDTFGFWSLVGVTVTTGGGYVFTTCAGKVQSKDILPINASHQA